MRFAHFLFTCILAFAGLSSPSLADAIDGLGINWGTIARRQLPPDITVQLLQDNGIKKVKLFDADPNIISALAGSGIEVMVAVPNNDLAVLGDYSKAKDWVKSNVTKYNVKDKDGVKITLVGVGNEPFLSAYKDQFTKTTLPAMKNIVKALNEAGLKDTVKVTIPLNADVYYSPSDNAVPSAGVFRGDIGDIMGQICEYYHQTGNPFMVNIYPFLSYYTSPNFPIEYAFFDGKSAGVDDKAVNVHYSNVFDAIYDTLIGALNKTGFSDMPIIIGEIGWPTDGNIYANNQLAERFYDGLLKKAAKKEGTPRRPKSVIDMYLFGLYDEDMKSTLPGDFEPHWGIFNNAGQPKFPMDLAGTGEKKMPDAARGVELLPNKWCVYNPDAKDDKKLSDSVKYACDRADCTVFGKGSSCSGLDEHGQASYAFNSYFQNQNQTTASCDFNGLAKVTTKDPSSGNCTFTIGVDWSKLPASAPGSAGGSHKRHGSSSDDDDSGSHALQVPLFVAAILGLFSLVL